MRGNSSETITKWIDKQKAFEKHKNQLDEIYGKLNEKSIDHLGFKNNTLKFMAQRNKILQHMFKFNETGSII